MDNINKISNIKFTYYAGGIIKGRTYVGGILGEIAKEIYNADGYNRYYSNYVETNLISEDISTVSLGIGNMPKENLKLIDTYYYKYSTINGKNPNKQNEIFIGENQYLEENDLKKKETYINKLKWLLNDWNFEVLNNNKYPILKTTTLPNQEGIEIPKDAEHIIKNFSNEVYIQNTENDKLEEIEVQENTFKYENKTIKTYSTYSVIEAEDGSSVRRDGIKLYVKNGKLYAVPAILNSTANYQKLSKEEQNGSDYSKEVVTPVANNLILDNYNGKEYETVLGSDGKIYDLKEPLNYPENFVNKDIKSIGNNLNDNLDKDSENIDNEKTLHEHEIEVVYQNGDKLRFNYQTGELINSLKAGDVEKIGLFEYLKEKTSEIGNSNSGVSQKITNKYEESIKLQNKLEETPIEEALQLQNSNGNKLEGGIDRENNAINIKNESTIQDSEISEEVEENNETNNSLKEKKYISIYNKEKDDYQIYQEEELLDTTKQEVVSENDKIEANNLKEYYASEGESRNNNMGILWITLSIVGVIIILFVIKKRD